MPNIFEMSKDYFIDSEEDIPEEYKEIIEQKLSHSIENETVLDEHTPGKRGEVISKEEELKGFFKDKNNIYFGHGTPGGEETIDSILDIGLKVKDPEAVRGYMATLRGLSSTTIEWGQGTDDMFDDKKAILDNWPHKESDNIIIISAPKEYELSASELRGAGDPYEAFYVGSEHEGYRLRPEFIRGIYNANSHSITLNENFYENLPEESQEKLFEEMKNRFIEAYAKYAIHAPKETKIELPLDEEGLEQASIEWYMTQLERLRKSKEEREKLQEIEDEEEFDTDGVWLDLDEMSDATRISDFDETTKSIKQDVQERKEEKENEGWSVDDDW